MNVISFDNRKYGELLAVFVPAVIRTEEEYDRAIEQIENLLKKGDRISAEEERLLDLLSTLVEKYEDEHYPIEPAAPHEITRERSSSEQPRVIVADNMPPDIKSKIERMRQLAETAPLITTNPERMGGAPVIGIERMPITTLLDYLIEGYSVDEFIECFPGTDRDRVIGALRKIREAFEEGLLTNLMAEKVDY
jgi:HTH-type transcriptional regulator/antitoxin HigA